MRTRAVFAIFVAIGFAIVSGSALAQTMGAPPNPAAEAQWNRFLANHPKVEAGMVNDPNYLAKHPGIASWLHDHPDVARYARRQGEIGGWDKHNQWHDRHWWQSNDRDWVRDHHPDWAEDHPNYAHTGDYDEHHEWHDRRWWVEHNHPWVAEHHPNWFKENPNHQHGGDHDHD